jgi:hypothetical protein
MVLFLNILDMFKYAYVEYIQYVGLVFMVSIHLRRTIGVFLRTAFEPIIYPASHHGMAVMHAPFEHEEDGVENLVIKDDNNALVVPLNTVIHAHKNRNWKTKTPSDFAIRREDICCK